MNDQPWTRKRYAVVDVEGNGQRPPDLVELAVVSIVDGEIGNPDVWLIKPDTPITTMAQRIHGISNEMVATAPAFLEVEKKVRDTLAGFVFVAHNAGVDLGVLQRKMPDFQPAEVLDTLKLARRLLPDQANHRLTSLVNVLGLAENLSAADLVPHRAAYDALMAARLLQRLAIRNDGAPVSFAELRDGSGEGGDALF
jgi:DNA polymerase III epsilon subunit-like protein